MFPVAHRTLCFLSLMVAACASNENTLQVYAASSLTEAFGAMELAFEDQHPDQDVQLVFAGSQVLRLQIEQGAPADVYASANRDHGQALADQGLLSDLHPFAHNRLGLIVPLSNPAKLQSVMDLPQAQRIVLGTEQVPAGRYAQRLLQSANTVQGDFEARVMAQVVSRESNVRLVRAKVALGEADAALVYHTDAVASERVRAVPIPDALNPRVDYVMGRVGQSADALQWMTFVHSPAGQTLLERHGFGGAP